MTSPLGDDRKTYERRVCPVCGGGFKVRTYPRATNRHAIERLPVHNYDRGKRCGGSRMTIASVNSYEATGGVGPEKRGIISPSVIPEIADERGRQISRELGDE